jgi:hypothetical protein
MAHDFTGWGSSVNLLDWLKRRPKGNEQQVALVAALAQAVEDGHRDGMQYAGWSPGSIEIGSDGRVDLSALDASNRPKDDLAYTAPEAADGGPRTSRSDVYSAGVILYEILSGAHPFGGLSVKQPRGAPKPLGDVRRDLPKDLADAVTACLERDPEWRPADLSYVLHTAQEANAKGGKSSGRPAPTPAPAAPARTSSSGGGRRDTSPSFGSRTPQRSRFPLILLGIIVVLAGTGGAAYMFLFQGANDTAPTGPAKPSPAPTATAAATEAPTEAPTATASAAPTLPTVDKRGTPAPPTAAPTVATAAATEAPTKVATTAPTAAAIIPAATTATAAPTAPPTAAPTAAAVEVPAGPTSLKSVSPPKVKRGATALLDVRGENIRAGHKVRVQHKGKDIVGELTVARQRLVDPGLLQVLLVVSANAPTGPYTMSIVENDVASNALPFEIVQ